MFRKYSIAALAVVMLTFLTPVSVSAMDPDDNSATAATPGAVTMTFQEGVETTVDGVGLGVTYAGTHDTYIPAGGFANAINGNQGALFLDDANPRSDGLIRFENVFGSGVGQIPVGAQIVSASVRVRIFDAGTAIEIGEIHTDQSWDEGTASWNSVLGGNGVTFGVDTTLLGLAIPLNFGPGSSDTDVTASLTAWSADPSLNNGWGWRPTTGNQGLMAFYSSENANASVRPRLSVTFVADTDGDGVNDDVDNCVDDVNPLQENNDGDALGDVCDPDDDNDGFDDATEIDEGSDPFDADSVPTAAAAEAVTTELEALLTDPGLDPAAEEAINDALNAINGSHPMARNGALNLLDDGLTVAALGSFADAIEDLEAAELAGGLDLTDAKATLTAAARTVALAYIDSARVLNPGHKKVGDADALMAEGDVLRDAGSYSAAATAYKNAASKVQQLLR